jgi:DNA-binding response OmpR family regulator
MKKILIIEDDPVLNTAYKQKLEGKFEIISAIDGETGLNQAIGEKPELIILDLILPGLENGLHLLSKLKNNNTTKNIPVIVITNIDNQSRPALEMGAVDYLIKSNIDMNQVVEKINIYLRKV